MVEVDLKKGSRNCYKVKNPILFINIHRLTLGLILFVVFQSERGDFLLSNINMIDYISTLSRRLTSQFSLVLHKLMPYISIYLNEYHIMMFPRRRNRITVISESRLDKSGGTIPPSG
jgi:hypothetical protein